MNNQFEFRRLIRKRVQQLFVRVQSRWRAVSVTGLVFIVLHARCRHTNLRRAAPVIFFNCLMSRTYLWMSRFAWETIHAQAECEDAPKMWTWNSKSNGGHPNIKWDCNLYRIDPEGILDHWAQGSLEMQRAVNAASTFVVVFSHPVIILGQKCVFCALGN